MAECSTVPSFIAGVTGRFPLMGRPLSLFSQTAFGQSRTSLRSLWLQAGWSKYGSDIITAPVDGTGAAYALKLRPGPQDLAHVVRQQPGQRWPVSG